MTKYNIEKRIEKIKNMNILKVNVNHIIGFINDQSAQGNSKSRQIKYLSVIGQIGLMVNYNFETATKDDIKELCSKINNMDKSDWTKHDYLLTLKVFFKYLRDTEEYPPEVKWIKLKKIRNHKKLPRDLITIEDAKLLANNTNNPRDRCFIIVLYESGARINELLELKIRDVEFDKYGVKVTLPDSGKTGARKLPLIASAPAISDWLNHHPKRNDKHKPLFCGIWSKNIGETLDYRTIYEVLKDARNKAGLDKPVNPHHFRHSRATELAQRLTEAQLCQFMGWVIGSREAATYVHLSGRDLNDAVLEMYGIKRIEDRVEKFKPIECPRCGIKNDPAAKFCNSCSLGLDEKTMIEYDNKKDIFIKTGLNIHELIKDNDFKTGLLNLLVNEWKKLQKSTNEK